MTAGAPDKPGNAYQATVRKRQARAAQIRAAKASFVGESELTAEQLLTQQRQLKAAYYQRQQERAALPRLKEAVAALEAIATASDREHAPIVAQRAINRLKEAAA